MSVNTVKSQDDIEVLQVQGHLQNICFVSFLFKEDKIPKIEEKRNPVLFT